MKRRIRLFVFVLLAAMLGSLGIGAVAVSQPAPSPVAGLAALRQEIQAVERELAKVAALQAEVAQLERTVAIMTPLLADRGNAQRTGDVNGDGRRDDTDLRLWYCCRSVPASQPVSACWYVDMDKSGTVDVADLQLLNAAIKR